MVMREKKAAADSNGVGEKQRAADYLRGHPDFFRKHPELLAEMSLPREDREGTISLQERQVQQLREQQAKVHRQLEGFIKTARENGELEQRIQDLALDLLALNGGEPLQRAVKLVQERFGIDYIALRMAGKGDPEAYSELAQRVKHLGSVCDDRLPSKLLQALFDQTPDKVHSCALIPVARNKELHGVLALGSRAPDRFHPDLGAMYLDRLGAMLGALACR